MQSNAADPENRGPLMSLVSSRSKFQRGEQDLAQYFVLEIGECQGTTPTSEAVAETIADGFRLWFAYGPTLCSQCSLSKHPHKLGQASDPIELISFPSTPSPSLSGIRRRAACSIPPLTLDAFSVDSPAHHVLKLRCNSIFI